MQLSFCKIELKAKTTEGIDAEDELRADAKTSEIDDSCLERSQRTLTDRQTGNRNKRDFDGGGRNADNPAGAFLRKAELFYEAGIAQTLRGSCVRQRSDNGASNAYGNYRKRIRSEGCPVTRHSPPLPVQAPKAGHR